MLKRFYTLSLRTQLVSMAMLLALPAFVLIFYSGYLRSQDDIHEALQDARMLTYGIAQEQNNLTGNIEQLLTALAQIPEIENRDPASHAILTEILQKNPQYGNIIVCKPDGEVWASGRPMKTAYSAREFYSFKKAVSTRRFSTGEYNVGRISGRKTIGFGYPMISNSGALTGAILANIDFVNLSLSRSMAGLPKGTSYRIIDHDGMVVSSNPYQEEVIGTKLTPRALQEMQVGPEGASAIGVNSAGVPSIVAYHRLRLAHEPSPYLYVRATIPLKETQKKAVRSLFFKIAVLSPVLIAAIFLVLRIGDLCFLRRIGRLQSTARRLAEGDLQARVADAVQGSELGQLAQAFDEMAEKLAKRDAALLRSRQELDDLYDNAPCGYHTLDRTGLFTRINNTEIQWLGYRRDQVIGVMRFADIVEYEGQERAGGRLPPLESGEGVQELECTLLRSDGSRLPVLLSATTLRDPEGTLLKTRCTVHDMTQRKAMELALQGLNQSLTHQVEEETQRRVRHERLLARHARLAAMGEMIAAIAHQWRQPLATLGATIQGIRMAWERGRLDQAFLVRAEGDAQKQLYYMSDTIEDFRNFFSPEKVAESFDIREKVGEVALLVSSQFKSSGVRLQLSDPTPDCPLAITGYQNEFKQALLNLISNSLDAVREKGRRQGDAAEGVVTVELCCQNGRAVVEVRDNGCGIPDEYADKIFDPYFTSKSEGKGTGLGLYMTKLIVEESLGGNICFSSGPEGTTFRMDIARDDAEEARKHG